MKSEPRRTLRALGLARILHPISDQDTSPSIGTTPDSVRNGNGQGWVLLSSVSHRTDAHDLHRTVRDSAVEIVYIAALTKTL